jgi:hypothetical protein
MKQKKEARDNWMTATGRFLLIIGAVAIASTFVNLPDAKSLVEILNCIVPTCFGFVFWIIGYIIINGELKKKKIKEKRR